MRAAIAAPTAWLICVPITDVFAQVTPQLREQLADAMAVAGKRVNEGAFPL